MTLLIHPLRICYVRVPKTASTSFVNALDELKPEHIDCVHSNATGLRNLLEKRGKGEWETYRRIGFLRHPYQWVRSAYRHWKLNPKIIQVGKPRDEAEFAMQVRNTPYEWLCDADGNLVCEIFRTEDMAEVMAGLGLELHFKNVKFTEPYEPDERTAWAIRRRFARDFEAGNYEA